MNYLSLIDNLLIIGRYLPGDKLKILFRYCPNCVSEQILFDRAIYLKIDTDYLIKFGRLVLYDVEVANNIYAKQSYIGYYKKIRLINVGNCSHDCPQNCLFIDSIFDNSIILVLFGCKNKL